MLSDIILSVILILLSFVWAWVGIFDLGLWIPGVSADSGFIPTIFSVITLICSVIMLVQNMKKYRQNKPQTVEKQKEKTDPPAGIKEKILAFVKRYFPVFLGVFGILCLQYLGLVPMVFLVIFGWMKLMNGFSWVKSVAFSAAVTVVVYMIFDVWLQIPFPGLF